MRTLDHSVLPGTRAEARERGFAHFFTGKPCKHGHVAPRYVSTTQCVSCQLEHARQHGGWGARPSAQKYLDRVRAVVTARGGVLLSTEYVSARAKLKVRCERGHVFEPTPDNLKQGRWCRVCRREKHVERMAAGLRSVKELRDFARARHSGDCLGTQPSPVLTKVRWKCAQPDHPPFQATISSVLNGGHWCPVCWQERRLPPQPAIPFETVDRVVRERGGEIVSVALDGKWIGSKTRLGLRCANGHEWSADASNIIYAGSWCPVCLNKGERIVRAIFEATFGAPFPKSKPDWLRSKTGRRLELDGYNTGRAIAFEYQGPHHFTEDAVKAHDAIKRQACADAGVRLIEVEAIKRPYPPENVLKKVAEVFLKLGMHETPALPDVEIFPDELRQLQELARKRGGVLVTEQYLGCEVAQWQCGNPDHPSWAAEPWRVRKGAWCPSCAGNRRLSLDDLKSWGGAVGLELLDQQYQGGAHAIDGDAEELVTCLSAVGLTYCDLWRRAGSPARNVPLRVGGHSAAYARRKIDLRDLWGRSDDSVAALHAPDRHGSNSCDPAEPARRARTVA